MSFYNNKGIKIEGKDLDCMKKIYTDLLNGYRECIKNCETKRFKAESEATLNLYNEKVQEFLTKFDEASKSEEEVNIERFYNRNLMDITQSILTSIDQSSRYFDSLNREFMDQLIERYSPEIKAKDTFDGLERTMSTFQLTTKAFKGIEKIDLYNPKKIRPDMLSEARKSNSNTYSDNSKDPNSPQVQDANYGYISATEFSRSKSVELMRKAQVSFSDLYETFSSINTILRMDLEKGGKIRTELVQAGKINGIASPSIPGHLYRMLNTVAENMNKIKQTKDPQLQKSQAIQLASFAYQMSVSEHVFADGNGRSCRLLADTILGAFGLPPHTPHIGLITTGATIGEPIDFNNGARLFMKGVSISDNLLKLEKNTPPEHIEETAQGYLNEEKIPVKCPQDMKPKEAVSFAVQVKENKNAMVEALNEFISADHLFTNNSPEYKDVIKAAKATLKTLAENDINSGASKRAFKKLQKTIKDYEYHCRIDPRTDARRRKRLKAVFNLGQAAFYTEEAAKTVRDIQLPEVKENVSRLMDGLVTDIKGNAKDPMQCLAEAVIVKLVEKDIKSPNSMFAIDEYKQFLTMPETMINKIKADPDLANSLNEVLNSENVINGKEKEILSKVSEKFIDKKEIEVAKKIKETPKKELEKNGTPQLSFLNK